VLERLSEAEQAWLADGAFRLLVPLRGTTGKAIGMLALGEKKSELPYSSEDRSLLAAVGASGGLAFESRTLRERQSDSGPSTDSQYGRLAAAECLTCGRVYAQAEGATRCECGAGLVEAAIPPVLAQKFQIDRRIGAGGMGVVYLASDLTLGRSVAIKTLPRADANETWRLRREARAMALVNHENLAMIYAVESWNGAPLLVQEYLPGGTLADRLAQGRLPVGDVLALGIVLGRLLETIHAIGLLHRDIKPSNIGYTGNGTVKLLDFGLAQIVTRRDASSSHVLPPDESGARRIAALGHATQQALGTPAYMAPEAIRNERPSVSFDLWSLAVVLVEALIGRNPFLADTVLDTLGRIQRMDVAVVLAGLPANPEMAQFFAAALAADRRRRPATAADFVRRLTTLRDHG
jgi:serine/threonine protein kinase